MPTKTRTIKFAQTVNASPAQVYRAFTNATVLRRWLCDAAQVDARKNGRVYVWWSTGYYAVGEFTTCTPEKKIVLTWHGRGDPAATRVQVTLAAKGDRTIIALTHSGLGTGKIWDAAAKQIARGWQIGLENLQHLIETGQDLRLVRRPMLGINAAPLTPEKIAELGAPIKEGICLDGVVEGKGAHAAGLQKNDVIVGLAGKRVNNFPSLLMPLRERRAGDKVQVVFYRGAEKKRVTMELSARNFPKVPATAAALVTALEKMYTTADAELVPCFDGVSEIEADHAPAPKEWNAKQVLAHLIIVERENHSWIADLIEDSERLSDNLANPTTVSARVDAITQTFRTVSALLEELQRNEIETVKMIAALPPEVSARKDIFWQMGYNLLQIADHTRSHLGQIRAAIESARK
ncbi:MAG: SRPBCC domain-containing protein [Anaerolineales bacterium]|nr:SRPBCC domain-containing protein [Anaerolineales bacterium]